MPESGQPADLAATASSACQDHYDLFLETDLGCLLAWRIPKLQPICEPTIFPSASYQLERIPNHRSIYLDYEGPLSGNRGWVSRRYAGGYLATVVAAGGSQVPKPAEPTGQVGQMDHKPRAITVAPLNLKWLEVAIACGLPQVLEIKFSDQSRFCRAKLEVTDVGQTGNLIICSAGSENSFHQSSG